MKRIILFIITFLSFATFYISQNNAAVLEPVITVEFEPNTMKNDIGATNAIQKYFPPNINNPQIIVWGAGEDGLTERSLLFYRNNVFKKLNARFKTNYCCFFYDLSAWRCLKNPNINPLEPLFPLATQFNEYMRQKEFNVQLLSSSEFFQYLLLTQQTNEYFIDYAMNVILKRDAIWQVSKNFKILNGINVEYTFLQKINIFQDYLTLDTASIYSSIQYLEAIFLVKNIIEKELAQNPDANEINVVFLLPKGETHYYRDSKNQQNNFFENDLNQIITQQTPKLMSQGINVHVSFISFKYSDEGYTRPYTLKQNGRDRLITSENQLSTLLWSNP